jgi:hypothetical protein
MRSNNSHFLTTCLLSAVHPLTRGPRERWGLLDRPMDVQDEAAVMMALVAEQGERYDDMLAFMAPLVRKGAVSLNGRNHFVHRAEGRGARGHAGCSFGGSLSCQD